MPDRAIREGKTRRNDGTNLNTADFWSNSRTSMNEVAVAEYTPIIELKSTLGLSDRRDVQTTTGSASISTTNGEIKLSTGSTANSKATLDTALFGPYLSGLEALAGAAFRAGSSPTGNQVIRVGYFNANDGFGVQLDSTSLAAFLRNGGTETVVRRSDWDDPLDGTGASGHNLDILDMNIWRMPFRWYGGGPVRFFTDVINDNLYPDFVPAHAIGRQGNGVIFQDTNLPIRCEVENGSTTENLDVFIGGRHFGVFGRYAPTARVISEERTGVTVGTSGLTPLISIRFKDAFKGVPVIPSGIDIITTSDISIYGFYNGSLTDDSFTTPSDTTASETAMEVDTSSTAYSAGDKNWSGGASGGSGNQTVATGGDLPDIPLAAADTYTLAAQAIDSSATVDAWLRWEEQW